MSEIIQKWITQKTGLVLSMSPETFASDLRDGTILARLLYSYNIMGKDEFLSITPSPNYELVYRNFQRLSCWLQAAGVEYSEEALLEVPSGKGSSALKLFYQLYLALHDKDKLHFATNKKVLERLHDSNNRFEVRHVSEVIDDPLQPPINPLHEPLVVKTDVIQWHQQRYRNMLEQYETIREDYSKYIEEKFGTTHRDKQTKVCFKTESFHQPDELNEKFPTPPDCTYEELAEQQALAQQMQPLQPNSKTARKILNTIKQKHRKEAQQKEQKLHEQRLLLLTLWEKQVAEQEKQFEEMISKKLLKQSGYEKQMVTKMFEVRQQKENILQNRRFLDDEILKKREEEFLDAVFMRGKLQSDQKYAYYFERDRTLELHRRLYAEKKRLKAQRHYNMCMDAVEDLTDIAIRHSEYKSNFNEEPPRRVQQEWTNLFIKQQPIFDILPDLEDIVLPKDLDEDLEEIYSMETERQDALDQREFEKYQNYEWPWELLEGFDVDLVKQIELGMNVLGFNVHRVLLTKYPRSNPPSFPGLPKYDVAACVNGISDPTILSVLQKLLNEKGVRVIEMEQAVNYCLGVFKEEIKTEYVDEVLIAETAVALDELKQHGKKREKAKSSKAKPTKGAKSKGVKAKGGKDKVASPITFAEKESQTPRIYPCEEILLSPAGELGKTAYDLLNLGEQLPDPLIVATLIEYLKTLKEIKGWVLINFPTSLTQAALLEEALTGFRIPGLSEEVHVQLAVSIGDVSDLQYRESQWEKLEQNASLRKSRLLPDPVPPREEPYYDTYLTAYIHSKPQSEGEELLQTHKAQAEEEDEADLLGEFYMDQGCYYDFYYKTFELATVKHLAKLIIGEYTVPPKTSLELFGDTVLYMEASLGQDKATPGKEAKSDKKGEKKAKPSKEKKEGRTDNGGSKGEKVVPGGKKGKPGSKKDKSDGKKDKSDGKKDKSDSKKDKLSKKGKTKPDVEIIAVAREDKETQAPEPEPEPEEIFTQPIPAPKPGEPHWPYSTIHFPEYFQTALASLWENAEEVYICDLKQLFFIKRITLNAVVPYLTQIRKHLDEFIARPDEKQTHLYQFQKLYNEIDEDLREDQELKSEMHCRITEFREKLWEICDARMRESEDERQSVIKQNWVANQLCELTNNYISAMQLEIDRCCDSFQFLIDYYSGLITKMPSEEALLQKSTLAKLSARVSDSVMSVSSSLKSAVVQILTVPGADSTYTSYHEALDKALKTCSSCVTKWKSSALEAVEKTQKLFQPKSGKADKGKGKKESKKASPKKYGLPKFTEPDPDVKEAAEQLLEEWKMGINGEFLRVNLRLSLLAERGKRDVDETLNCSKNTFHGLYDAIFGRYHKEVDCVNRACEVLARATEAETSIQPELVLRGDEFYVNPEVLLFPEALPPPEAPLGEKHQEATFTISQLDLLCNILMEMAPRASIPERPFVYLLQDLIVQNAEDGQESMVPPSWRKLQPAQVALLSRKLFGDVEFLDWRDFIVYNFCISFPTEEELLETRKRFRENDPDATETVKDYQFYDIKFWFEDQQDDPQETLRIALIKNQLIKLYKIDGDAVNYTALLLQFCKSDDPVEGFAKAVALALGKPVCWDPVIGEGFVESVVRQRRLEEQQELEKQVQHQEAVERCTSVLGDLIDKTVHVCDSVIIEDYLSEEEEEEAIKQPDVKQTQATSSMDVQFTYFNNENLEEGEEEEEEATPEPFLLEERFSNTEIGFESNCNPPKVYFLPFEVLLTVLTAALPWHSRAQTVNDGSYRERIEKLYDSLRNPMFNDAVLMHQLLNDHVFKRFFLDNFKFTARNPPEIVEKMLG